MIHFLLEGYDLSAPWLREALKAHLRSSHRVTVIALSYRDQQVKNAAQWQRLYGVGGYLRGGIEAGLSHYGIAKEQIRFIDPFSDSRESATEAVSSADVLYFPGGLPDRMLDRMKDLGITEAALRHQGIVIGYSAGALLQLEEYHLSPDHDYPSFCYRQGLPYLRGFYLEVHYEESEAQKAAIAQVLRERRRPVFATWLMQGGIMVENGVITPLGKVSCFAPQQ